MPNRKDIFSQRNISMKFSVPTNYQASLLDVAEKHGIDELMGASFGPVGHGCTLSSSSESGEMMGNAERGRHIREAADRGFSFNYVMDAPCIGNQEYDLMEKEKIVDHLKWVSDQGASAITVGGAFYIELVKHHLPHLSVVVSQSVYVDSIDKTRQFVQLGADGVTVHPDVNRSLSMMRALGEYPQWGVRAVVNSGCVFQCVYRDFHVLETGHHTSKNRGDLRTDTCMHSFKDMGPALVQMRWIRPEDVSRYTEMGIERFVILGQQRSTVWINAAIRIWQQGRFDGDLLPFLDGGVRLSPTMAGGPGLMSGRLNDFLSVFKNDNCRLGCHDCLRCSELAKAAVTGLENIQ